MTGYNENFSENIIKKALDELTKEELNVTLDDVSSRVWNKINPTIMTSITQSIVDSMSIIITSFIINTKFHNYRYNPQEKVFYRTNEKLI